MDDDAPHRTLDPDWCYHVISGRDPRFDGWFTTAVTTTGIYCRPSCPAVTPRRRNVRFFRTPAAAQQAGFRACKRCRPDAAPGSPEWNTRADVAARAVKLIADGVVDRDGVGGLARRLAYSERHLGRLLRAELGAGPLALARAQRAHTARLLLETTDLPVTDIAFAAGFSSVRQFNDTVLEVFAANPTELRGRRSHGPRPAPGSIQVRLPFRPPLAAGPLLEFLGRRAVPGVETWDGTTYARVLDLPHGPAAVELSVEPGAGHADCRLSMSDWRDVGPAVHRCRRLLDLDADPVAVDAHLGANPVLAAAVARTPGLRSPGHVDGAEVAVRAVLGQQVSVAGARTVAGRLAAAHGTEVDLGVGGLTHTFPGPDVIAELDPEALPLPRARGRALVGLCRAVADGTVDLGPGADPDQVAARLRDLPGIGPWTADYVVMRALGHPDVMLPTDLGVHHAVAATGRPADPRSVADLAEAWRPWRSYALHHLWLGVPDGTEPTQPDTLHPDTLHPDITLESEPR